MWPQQQQAARPIIDRAVDVFGEGYRSSIGGSSELLLDARNKIMHRRMMMDRMLEQPRRPEQFQFEPTAFSQPDAFLPRVSYQDVHPGTQYQEVHPGAQYQGVPLEGQRHNALPEVYHQDVLAGGHHQDAQFQDVLPEANRQDRPVQDLRSRIGRGQPRQPQDQQQQLEHQPRQVRFEEEERAAPAPRGEEPYQRDRRPEARQRSPLRYEGRPLQRHDERQRGSRPHGESDNQKRSRWSEDNNRQERSRPRGEDRQARFDDDRSQRRSRPDEGGSQSRSYDDGGQRGSRPFEVGTLGSSSSLDEGSQRGPRTFEMIGSSSSLGDGSQRGSQPFGSGIMGSSSSFEGGSQRDPLPYEGGNPGSSLQFEDRNQSYRRYEEDSQRNARPYGDSQGSTSSFVAGSQRKSRWNEDDNSQRNSQPYEDEFQRGPQPYEGGSQDSSRPLEYGSQESSRLNEDRNQGSSRSFGDGSQRRSRWNEDGVKRNFGPFERGYQGGSCPYDNGSQRDARPYEESGQRSSEYRRQRSPRDLVSRDYESPAGGDMDLCSLSAGPEPEVFTVNDSDNEADDDKEEDEAAAVAAFPVVDFNALPMLHRAPPLPQGWVQATHYSGMMVYMHRSTRVVTFSRPYSLPSSSAPSDPATSTSLRKHSVPVSALPCLAAEMSLRLGDEHDERTVTDLQPRIEPEELSEYMQRRFPYKERESFGSRFSSYKERRAFTQKNKNEAKMQDGQLLIYRMPGFINPKDGQPFELTLTKGSNVPKQTLITVMQAVNGDGAEGLLRLEYDLKLHPLDDFVARVLVNGEQAGVGVAAQKKEAAARAHAAAVVKMLPDFPFQFAYPKTMWPVEEHQHGPQGLTSQLRPICKTYRILDETIVKGFTLPNGKEFSPATHATLFPFGLALALTGTQRAHVKFSSRVVKIAGAGAPQLAPKWVSWPVLETTAQFPTFSSPTPLVVEHSMIMPKLTDTAATKEDHELARTVIGQKVIAKLFPIVRTWWDAIEMAVLKGQPQSV